MVEVVPLTKIFHDIPNFAWQLLQCEIQLQASINVDGKDIAKLLSLYMRGVERLNSVQDRRENFFKNKVTTLMMKPNVVKSLSSPNKPKPEVVKKQTAVTPVTPQKGPEPKMLQKTIVPNYQNRLNLQQKKKQMQMRITYQSAQHSQQSLNKLISQHSNKATTVTNCIQNVITENTRRIDQRIRERKMRSLSARSRSEKNNEHKDEKKMMIDIEVIKEETEEEKKMKKLNVKRRYSFEEPIREREEFQKIEKKPRRRSVFEIRLTFTEVHNH